MWARRSLCELVSCHLGRLKDLRLRGCKSCFFCRLRKREARQIHIEACDSSPLKIPVRDCCKWKCITKHKMDVRYGCWSWLLEPIAKSSTRHSARAPSSPSILKVDVSIVNATIRISWVEDAQVEDPDPLKKLRSVAWDSHGLSFITTWLYISTVGDSFMENIRNVQTNRSVLTDTISSAYKAVVLDVMLIQSRPSCTTHWSL